MTNITPLTQSPLADLHAALEIADTWSSQTAHHDPEMSWRRIQYEFEDIARLLRHAIEQLGEPSFACVQATAVLLREARNEQPIVADRPRYARDAAELILRAAITGEIPPTWSEP